MKILQLELLYIMKQEPSFLQSFVNRGGRQVLEATTIRDIFKDYFIGAGAVGFQDHMLGLH